MGFGIVGRVWLTGAILAGLLCSTGQAATLVVKADGTGTYRTIQAAIDGAAAGDEVVLQPGTYRGDGNRDIEFRGKAITVRGTDATDPAVVAATVVDCQGTAGSPHGGFSFRSGESSQSALRGITIIGAHFSSGGGISCNFSSPRIESCTVRDCMGRGIYCTGGSPSIAGCTITANQGHGIEAPICTLNVSGCRITGNSGAGVYSNQGVITISNSAIVFNRQAGIYASHHVYSPSLRCIIRGSTVAYNLGWGIYLDDSSATADDSILWGNEQGAVSSGSAAVQYSAVPAGVGGIGNIHSDPRLRPDLHLRGDSPCIEAGSSSTSGSDIDGESRPAGSRCDMGADEFHDVDGDRLPDWWEVEFFGSPAAATATDDPDHDGLDNLAEYNHNSPALAAPRTYYVNAAQGQDAWDGLAPAWNGAAGPKATIQAAIDIAWSGDLVIVAPGMYRGPGNGEIRFGGKAITVQGTDPLNSSVVATTIVDGRGNDRLYTNGFIFDGAEGRDSVLAGLTVTRAGADGVFCGASSPTILRCNISGNFAAGICCRGGAPAIRNCLAIGNSGTGISCAYSAATIANSISAANALSGISCTTCNPAVSGCTLAGNVEYGVSGGGSFRNCVVWGNQKGNGWANFSHCALSGTYSGQGNLNVDPKLGAGFHLQAGSPCINAGDPAYAAEAGETDFDGEPRVRDGRADIGADEFADTDGNTLPDWWESQEFGAATGVDPAADADGDGAGSLQEYGDGTVPTYKGNSFYVEPTGGCDGWDGLLPAWNGVHGPKQTVQCAMDTTVPGREVVLEPGTYTFLRNRNLDYRGRAITVRGVNPQDPAVVATVVIDCQGSSQDEQQGVLFHSKEGRGSVLAGVTICHGYRANITYGGGIVCDGASPTIRRCIIRDNTGGYWGGGLYCYGASPLVQDCAITGNTAKYGGGIYSAESDLVISGSSISNNVGHWGSGGGVYLCQNGTMTMTDCTLIGNATDVYSAYDDAYGGAIYCRQTVPTITRCLFDRNTSDTAGGAIYIEAGAGTVRNCTMTNNVADSYGGAIALSEASAVVSDSRIASNSAGLAGGAVYFEGAGGDFLGCTITGNTAAFGGGLVMMWAGEILPTVRNCVLWGNGESLVFFDAAPAVTYSLVQGGWVGAGNLNVDPKLSADGRLETGSPCINAGDPAYVPAAGETDIDGGSRVAGGRIDIGCDEYAAARMPGDANHDGAVDLVDLLLVACSWGKAAGENGYDAACDFNSDDSVDVVDLLTLAENFGKTL